MARSMFSPGMFSFLPARMAARRRGLEFGSPPPMRAAMVISRITRVKTRPRLASVAAFLCLIVAHFGCPDMRLPRFELRARRREFRLVRDLLPFSLVPWLVKVRPPHALPERMAGTQIHDAETFSELLQNAPEPKQFSTGCYRAKRVYFLLGSSFISPRLRRQGLVFDRCDRQIDSPQG